MKRNPKFVLAIFILLIVCFFIATYIHTPESKVTNTYSSGKTTAESHPSNSEYDSNAATYKDVTPEVFNCMKQKLKAIGIQIPQGYEGNIEGKGVKVHFKWDGVSQLTLSIKDKPWYVSHGTIAGKIHNFVIECGGNK